MLAHFSTLLLAVVLVTAMLSQGCIDGSDPEVTIELPEAAFEPPTPEKTLVFSVTAAPHQDFKFTVYNGRELNPESRLDAGTEAELRDLITLHIYDMIEKNPALDTVLIECEGSVRTGEVELVKSGVSQAGSSVVKKIYVGILEEAEVADDD